MNINLREAIVRHIFSGLAIIPSNFIDLSKTKPLKHKDFLLEDTVVFTDEHGIVTKNKVWGCQFTIENKELKLILADCSQDALLEYALLIYMQDSPCYGIYLIDDPHSHDSLIACSLDNKNWMECQTYLQATFLAAMEHMKETNIIYVKCLSYKEQYKGLLSFIKFHNRLYEAKYL